MPELRFWKHRKFKLSLKNNPLVAVGVAFFGMVVVSLIAAYFVFFNSNSGQASTISSITPNFGSVQGGTPVEISGSDFDQEISRSVDLDYIPSGSDSFFDTSGNNLYVKPLEDASLSDTQTKIGSFSGYFDGTDDRLEIQDIDLDTFRGTIETWVYPTDTSNTQENIFGNDNGGNDLGVVTMNGNFYVHDGNSAENTNQAVSYNTWQHIALEIETNQIRFYHDGNLIWSKGSGPESSDGTNYLVIGEAINYGLNFEGYLDEFRVSDISRYGGSNFTPYTTALTSDANTVLLLPFEGEIKDHVQPVFLDTASLVRKNKILSSCADLEVLDSDQTTSLDFWVENCNSAQTIVWVKVGDMTASKTIYLKYGTLENKGLSDLNTIFPALDSSNNQLWLSASDIGLEYRDTEKFNVWRDRSNQKNNVVQTSSDENIYPTLRENSLNGNAMAEFDGTDWLVSENLLGITGNTEKEVFLVSKANTGTSGHKFYLGNECAYQGLGLYYDINGNFNNFRCNNDLNVTGQNFYYDYYLGNFRIESNGYQEININQTYLADRTHAINSPDANLWLGSRENGSGPMNGFIGEMIVLRDGITDLERAEISNYLNLKYALYDTSKFPSTTLNAETDNIEVTIDGNICTDLQFIDTSTLRCLTPAGTAGAKNVIVTDSTGIPANLNASFTYQDISVSGVNTANGQTTGNTNGGQQITVTGQNFSDGFYQKVDYQRPPSQDNHTNFFDLSGKQRETNHYGDIHSTTSKNYFGTRSLYLDGIGDKMTIQGIDLDTFTGTIETWVYPTDSSNTQENIFGNDNGGYDLGVVTVNGNFRVHDGNSSEDTGQAVSYNTWQHIALEIETNQIRFYYNGNLIWSKGSGPESPGGANYLVIGEATNHGLNFEGYLDEFRVSSVSRYSGSNFTPQTKAFQTDANTELLLNFEGDLPEHPLLINFDTASLITAGKLDSECKDLEVVDFDKTTHLSFWIEEDCNTANTKIWVKVPVLSQQTQSFYFKYGTNQNLNLSSSEKVLAGLGGGQNRLWLAANDFTYSGDSGTSYWLDRSKNKNHTRQTNATYYPTYRQTETNLNGYPSVQFGGDDWLGSEKNLGISGNNAREVFMIHKATTGTSGHVFYTSNTCNGNNLGLWHDGSGNYNNFRCSGNDFSVSGQNFHYDYYLGNFRIESNGYQEININQQFLASQTVGINSTDGQAWIGSRENGGGPMNGYIAEFIILQADLTEAQRSQISFYLNQKYQLYQTASLPSFSLGSETGGQNSISVNAVNCTEVLNISQTEARCTLPPGTAGAVSLEITNADTSSATSTNFFTYQDATLTSISPISGNYQGGFEATVNGTNFSQGYTQKINLSGYDSNDLTHPFNLANKNIQPKYFNQASTTGLKAAQGNKSAYFDGYDDYLEFYPDANLNPDTGDFTIEFWAYQEAFDGWDTYFEFGNYSDGILFRRINQNTVNFYINGTNRDQAIPETLNTWNHYAISRASGTVRVFYNGSQISSFTDTSDIDIDNNFRIGASTHASGQGIRAYIDEFRLSKVSHYSSNFTPTTDFDVDNDTAVLLNFEGEKQLNYKQKLNLDTASLITAGKMQTDCSDISFLDADFSTVLPHWTESGCNTNNTQIWVDVDELPQTGKSIYLRYGYDGQSDTSDVNAVFPSLATTDTKLWLVANDLSQANGTGVNFWPDRSTNQNHAFQDNASYEPTFYENQINSQAAIRFDVNDDRMETAAQINSGNYEIYTIYNYENPTVSAARRVVQGSNAWLMGPYSVGYRLHAGNWTSGERKTYTTDFVQQTAKYFDNIDTLENYVNQDLVGNLASTTTYPDRLGLGAQGNWTEPLDGFLAEVIAVNDDLNYTLEREVEDYLEQKYQVKNLNYFADTEFEDELGGVTDIEVGGNNCTSSIFVSGLEIKCTAPATTGGSVDVVATNPDSVFDTLTNGFTYLQPSVTGATPDSGSLEGGTDVTISGNDFFQGDQTEITVSRNANNSQQFSENSDNKYPVQRMGDNPKLTNTQTKYGNYALELDGNGDALTFGSQPGFDVDNKSFTVEGWVRFDAIRHSYIFSGGGTSDTSAWLLGLESGGDQSSLALWLDSNPASNGWDTANNLSGTTNLSANTWYHIALVRTSTDFKVYLDGNEEISLTSSLNLPSDNFNIGSHDPKGNTGLTTHLDGFVDDVRFSNVARYTASFIPPATGLENDINTMALLDFEGKLYDYAVPLKLDTASLIATNNLKDDCSDMRFIASDGATTLDHWVESGCDTTETLVWVKMPELADGNTTIYWTYGYSWLSNTSDFTVVFDHLDSNNNQNWYAVNDLDKTDFDTVGYWPDRSSTLGLSIDNEASQKYYTSKRPVFYSDQYNGFGTLEFDGTDDYFDINLDSTKNQDYSMFIVEARNSNKSNNYFIGTEGSGLHLGYQNDTTLYQGHWTNDLSVGGLNGYSGQIAKLNHFHYKNGTGKQIFAQNGLARAEPQNGGFAGTTGSLGRAVSGYFSGDISEVIVFNTKLNQAGQNEVSSYLTQKYGLEGGLPSFSIGSTSTLNPAIKIADVVCENPNFVSASTVNCTTSSNDQSGTYSLFLILPTGETLNLVAAFAYQSLEISSVDISSGSVLGGDAITLTGNGFYADNLAQISAKNDFACAVRETGNVKCWGRNNLGQLGLGDTDSRGNDEMLDSYGDVNLGSGVLAEKVVTGYDHACVLTTDGNVKCWGNNDKGQLGYGNTTVRGDNETPDSYGFVSLGGATATDISAGEDFTCVVLSDGNVKCWGEGSQGRTGYGATTDLGDNETPDSYGVLDLSGNVAKNIYSGQLHSCIITATNEVLCWGVNNNGRLGYGNTFTGNIGDGEAAGSGGIVSIDTGTNTVQKMSLGQNFSCALLTNNEVKCWGRNNDGRLGQGNTTDIGDNELPSSINTINFGRSDVIDLTSGYNSSCVIFQDKTIKCWGAANAGALGYGNLDNLGDNETPDSYSEVKTGADIETITGGRNFFCSITDTKQLKCWGEGGSGRTGYGFSTDIGNDDLEWPSSQAPVSTDGSSQWSALVGSNAAQYFTAVSSTKAVIRTPAGTGQVALNITNALGETDTSQTFSYLEPTFSNINPVSGDKNGGENVTVTGTNFDNGIARVEAGENHTCLLTTDQKVKCWGNYNNGELGYGNTVNQDIGNDEDLDSIGYVDVGENVVDLAVGRDYTCVVTATGGVKCWGSANVGKLGYGNSNNLGDNEVPSSYGNVDLGGYKAVDVEISVSHTCVILDGGQVKCWGENDQGRLGYDTATNNNLGDNETPDKIGLVDIEPVTDIALNISATCALLDSGEVKCFGRGQHGQLGQGNTSDINTNDLRSINSVNTGQLSKTIEGGDQNFFCSILADDSVKCWGRNNFGQLGLGNTNNLGDDELPNSVGSINLGSGVTAKEVQVSSYHACVITNSDNVKCWGRGYRGRLGYGNTDNIGDNETPNSVGDVNLGNTAVQISSYNSHTCAVLTNDEVICWGNGGTGKLGYGNTNDIGDNETPASNGNLNTFVTSTLSVNFGSNPCTNLVFVSSTEFSCDTPNHGTAETVNILITNPDTGAITAVNAFQFLVGFEITFITPDRGPTIGGQNVTVMGSDFEDGGGAGTLDFSFHENIEYGQNGEIKDMIVQPDGKILIAGNFLGFDDINGHTNSSGINRLNADGTVDRTGFYQNGAEVSSRHVEDIDLQSDGKIMVAGSLSIFDGNNVNGIVRLNSDGTLDNSFTARSAEFTSSISVPAFYHTIKVQDDGKILVGGLIHDYDGDSPTNLIRLNSDGSLDPTFSTNLGTGLGSTVNAIEIQSDGKIIIATATTTSLNGSPVDRVFRLNSDGTLDNTFTGISPLGYIGEIDQQPDGKIILTGADVIRLNSDGTEDTTFNSNITDFFATGQVYNVETQSDGKLIFGGSFSGLDNTISNKLIRLNSDGTMDNSFNVSTKISTNSSVSIRAFDIDANDKIVISGNVYNFDGIEEADELLRVNTEGTAIHIGDGYCKYPIFISSSQIDCVTPPNTAGFKDVTADNLDGTNDTLPSGYEYFIDVYLVGGKIPGQTTSNFTLIPINETTVVFYSPINMKKEDGVTNLDEGTLCRNYYRKNGGSENFYSGTLDANGQCVTPVNSFVVSTLGTLEVKTVVIQHLDNLENDWNTLNVVENVVTDSVAFYFDAHNPSSYSGTGQTIYSLVDDVVGSLGGTNQSETEDPSFTSNPTSSYFSFDGSDDFINTGLVSNQSDSLSIETWFRSVDTNPLTSNERCVLVGYNFSGVVSPGVMVENTGSFGTEINGQSVYNSQTNTLSTDYVPGQNWHHAVYTYDKVTKEAKMYVNGVLFDTQTTDMDTLSDTANFEIGGSSLSSCYHKGDVSIARVYDKVLNQTEISQNFDAEKDRFGFGQTSINLTAPADASFENQEVSSTVQTVSVNLPDLTIEDRRQDFTNYNVTLAVSDALDNVDGDIITTDNIRIDLNAKDVEVGNFYYNAEGSGGYFTASGVAQSLYSNSANNGGGKTIYDPTLYIDIPAFSNEGSYNLTLTLDVI